MMEITITIIASIAGIITACISASAYLRGKREEERWKAKIKMDETRRRLALQVVGYFYEEELMAHELSTFTKEPIKSIKERMRKAVEAYDENKEAVYPRMTAAQARDYIINK